MNVLHINVRLQEGGAAQIGQDLHRRLLHAGINSKFAYGWGEKGGASSAEKSVTNSFQVGGRIQVASNIIAHGIVGFDLIPPPPSKRSKLITEIIWADIIHLHVIHSYFLPINWIKNILNEYQKPVLWTAHDYWALTGRCASPGTCRKWEAGCGKCPNKKSYPSSLFDLSYKSYQSKKRLIESFKQDLCIVAPSRFLAEEIRMALPGSVVRVIPNWIDMDFEKAVCELELSKDKLELTASRIKVLYIANNLSDESKVDRSLVRALANQPHIEIHTIGNNSPFSGARIVNHGPIMERHKLLHCISSMDVALFTSEKDTFGLVMIEALCCGTPVLAVHSHASETVLHRLGLRPLSGKEEIIDLLKNSKLPSSYLSFTPESLRDNILQIYSPVKAVNDYIAAYKETILRKK